MHCLVTIPLCQQMLWRCLKLKYHPWFGLSTDSCKSKSCLRVSFISFTSWYPWLEALNWYFSSNGICEHSKMSHSHRTPVTEIIICHFTTHMLCTLFSVSLEIIGFPLAPIMGLIISDKLSSVNSWNHLQSTYIYS